MLMEAVKYMILGMGVVFVFLYVMVIVLDWQHKILLKYFPQTFEDESSTPQTKTSRREKLKKVAAITAAIHHMKKS
ncbi:OadG family protein [Nitratiruptor sp. YY09-18]|uniref:OadG family protein n=1 Tax=Nitratiruptor sp. YY09-18 TaxID=2724901 RepID=UPI001915BAC8|nr:OadG family protein [Nitratiruptor sp. YY09-18]BCD67709.1 oxaloacetate decarboxylase (Na+ extruding) subunit gamma [Nitratiruptor sp. YY09-18]